MLALNALPPVLAGYREKGVLRRLPTTPVGPGRVLAAQLLINLAVAVVVRGRCSWRWPGSRYQRAAAAAGGRVHRSPRCWPPPRCSAIGLVIAAVAPTGRAAQAVGALLFFPMMFFAGLWLPHRRMPRCCSTSATPPRWARPCRP